MVDPLVAFPFPTEVDRPNPPVHWRIGDRLYRWERPVVMGIINATPDSFFAGSRVSESSDIVDRAGEMLEAGADILDIGGHSTRPGAETVPASEERDRLLPAVEAVRRAFPEALISLDTYRASVAAPALEAGGGLVNDVTGGEADPALPALAASRRVPYLLMHRQGTFKTMQQAPTYEDVVLEVFDYLNHRVDALRRMGVYDLAIDPGFGFGKSVAHNYQLLRHLGYFRSIGLPVLVGLSRKSMINKVLGIRASEALHGTIALQTVALMQGASLLRVHDVRPAVQTIQLLNHLYETV